MTTFFISDTHFDHRSILEFENRPFASVDEMNEEIIKNWNAVVKDGDTVYHLGDFSFGNKDQQIEILKRLKGNIILIKGNHDRSKIVKKIMPYLAGFYEVGHYLKVDKKQIWLTHFPLEIGARPRMFSVSGHIHSQPSQFPNQINVGCDSLLMREVFGLKIGEPVSLEQLLEYMNSIDF